MVAPSKKPASVGVGTRRTMPVTVLSVKMPSPCTLSQRLSLLSTATADTKMSSLRPSMSGTWRTLRSLGLRHISPRPDVATHSEPSCVRTMPLTCGCTGRPSMRLMRRKSSVPAL